MTSLARTSLCLVRRLTIGVLTIGLPALLAACDSGGYADILAKQISLEATPTSLTLAPGGEALVTLTLHCVDSDADDAGSITVDFTLLPAGIQVDRVAPAADARYLCTTREGSANPPLYTGQLTYRIRVDNVVALGPTPLTVLAEYKGDGVADRTTTVIDLTVAESAYGRNLLINPEFSTPVTQGLLPTAPGNWQGDLASSVPTEQGIAPRSAPSMLRFDATGNVGSTNTFASQQWQIVDVSAQAADIAAGRVRADASAWFNRVAGDPSTDRRFDIRLLAFSGTAAALPAAYAAGSQLAVQTGSILSSANAWQQATATMTLPPGTTLLLVEIYAFEDVANEGTPPEFAGHYADDISLVLTRQ